ncbi:MAG TPA: STAS domain-containing protein, partial [Thermoleophilaceae bacterium]
TRRESRAREADVPSSSYCAWREAQMTASELQAAVRERDGVPVIDLTGDVNSDAEAALNDAYAKATAGGTDAVVLNFARADYINSTGIALIVGLLAQARTSGIEVKAYGLSDHYREIFEITRLADFMTITDDEDRAVGGPEGSIDA